MFHVSRHQPPTTLIASGQTALRQLLRSVSESSAYPGSICSPDGMRLRVVSQARKENRGPAIKSDGNPSSKVSPDLRRYCCPPKPLSATDLASKAIHPISAPHTRRLVKHEP